MLTLESTQVFFFSLSIDLLIDKANPRSHWKHANMRQKIYQTPILKINHELDSIEVNKGWIQRELRYFISVLWNSIKSDNEMRWEIMGFDKFLKITWRKINGIKNHWIWIKILRKINERIKEISNQENHEKPKLKLNWLNLWFKIKI